MCRRTEGTADGGAEGRPIGGLIRGPMGLIFCIFIGDENKNYETFFAYTVNFSIYALNMNLSHLKTKFSNNYVCFLQPKNSFYHKIHKKL